MEIAHGLSEAWNLLVSLDSEVMKITLLTLKVSGMATLLSVAIGIPLGTLLGFLVARPVRAAKSSNFGLPPWYVAVISLFNTGMGLPPVVVGLWISILLWRHGPLGFFNLMYTPSAIVIAQTGIATPIVTALTVAAVQSVDLRLRDQLMALGTSRIQFLLLTVWEARLGLLAAVIAGFGSVISEIGASQMVGGNIKGYTRVLTTAIAMEVSKGNFGLAIALSIILLVITFTVVAIMTLFQQRSQRHWRT